MNPLLKHYGLGAVPFGRSMAKGALLRHPGFEEARRRLRYSAELDTIALLVSEPGCGKSLLLGEVADELRQEGYAVHYLAHSSVGPFGLLNVLARKVGVQPRRSLAETALGITEHLLADETKHLLVIDEGQ
jgi:type II secretory pathway predicted ATPase ExeA